MTKKNKVKVLKIGMNVAAFIMLSGYLFIFVMIVKMCLNNCGWL